MKSESAQTPRSPNGRIHAFVSPGGAYGYIPSLKVGSNTMTLALGWLGWEQMTDEPPTSCQLFGMIRHPFERWVSGTAQFWAGFYDSPNLDRERLAIEMLKNGDIEWFIVNGSHDQHTQPQAWNFDPYPNTKLFKFENLNKVWEWLRLDNPYIHKRNHTEMGFQGEMRRIIADRAEPYRDLILGIYKEDLELWNNAI